MSKLQVDEIVNKEDTGSVTLPKGAVVTGVTTSTSFSGSASGLTAIPAGNLTGTIPDARFPATLPAVSGANLTGIDVAPSFSGIASGSLSNGQTVIITHDGKVTGITRTDLPTPQEGQIATFEAGATGGAAMQGVYDPDTGRVIVVYCDADASNHGKAAAGLVAADGSITFGSEATWHGGATENVGVAYDTANDRIVVCGRDNGAANAVYNVGSLVGSTITFGSYGTLSTDGCREVKVAYDTNADRVLFIYKVNTGDAGKCRAGEVSGLTVSLGAEATFESGAILANLNSVTYYAAAQKNVITYTMASGGGYDGRANVATIDPSDNSVTFGTHGTVHSATNVSDCDSVYDPDSERIVIQFIADSVINAIVGQVTGTNITFGSKIVAYSTSSYNIASTYDTTNDKVVLMCRKASDGRAQMLVGNVNNSDNSISIASTTQIHSGSATRIGGTFDSNTGHVVFFFNDGDDGQKGKAKTYKTITATTNMTDGNFLGFSNAAYTNGQTAKIQIVGAIDDAQTGLTTGAKHYVQKNGSLATTADSPNVEAGTALSATQILIR